MKVLLYPEGDYKLLKLTSSELKEIFGEEDYKDKYVNLLSIYSVTVRSHADAMCKLIKSVAPGTKSILDSTVCIGGNTLSMTKYFDEVYGTEIDSNNFIVARYNMRKYMPTSHIINKGVIDFLNKERRYFDCIFFDPPWNIKDHIEITHHSIGIPNMSMKETIEILLDSTDFLVLKTHRNDNVSYYNEYIKDTIFEAREIRVSNYKLILFTNTERDDFKLEKIPEKIELPSFRYKNILEKNDS